MGYEGRGGVCGVVWTGLYTIELYLFIRCVLFFMSVEVVLLLERFITHRASEWVCICKKKKLG